MLKAFHTLFSKSIKSIVFFNYNWILLTSWFYFFRFLTLLNRRYNSFETVVLTIKIRQLNTGSRYSLKHKDFPKINQFISAGKQPTAHIAEMVHSIFYSNGGYYFETE